MSSLPAYALFLFHPAVPLQEPAQRSFLSWIVHSLGIYALMIPFAGMVVFIGACLAVAKGRRPEVVASYAAFAPIPFLVSLFGAFSGAIDSFTVIAMSAASPKPSEMAEGISTALATPLVGLLACVPTYLLLGVGWVIRMLSHREPPAH